MASVYLKPFTPAGDRVATAAEGHRGRNRHRARRGWPTYVVYAVTDGGERHRPGIRHEVAPSLDLRLLKDELEARSIQSKLRTSASGRISGGNPLSRGALYRMLQNRVYRGEIVHKEQLRGTRSQQFCRFLSPARCQSGLILGQKWTHCQQPLRV